MCGICGVYGLADHPIRLMVNTLAHRGPDGAGVTDSLRCALGHTRLAIIDLSRKGAQPMFSEDGMIAMVVNGEVYNYKDLRSQLQARGHSFRSESDSEVIVHAYEEWPEDFVSRLRGMFALAVYDASLQQLVLARDPIGKKPLYYAQHNGALFFASEVKALFAAGVPREVNYDMLPAFLMYQYSLGTETLFRGVHKVPAGHMMRVTPDGLTLERYWTVREREGDPVEAYLGDRNLGAMLWHSVRLRLQSDVPVGAFLSGGIDSSAVCALWRQQSSADIHTFTATFGAHSEAEYAKRVADRLGLTYHEVSVTPEMVARDIAKITWHHDEPLGDAATINTYYLAREARKYVKVVLAGEGGDELFGGYPWHHYARLIPWMNRVPVFLRLLGDGTLSVYGMGDPTAAWYGLGRKLDFPCQESLDELMLYPTSAMSWRAVCWLLKRADFQTMPPPISVNGIRDPLNRMLAMDCLNKLPEQYLMKADKGTMAWGIEERLPLLDREVIDYAFSLPPKMKRDKWVLRKSVEDLLPPDIVWRPKKGFGTPVREWLNSPALKPMVLDRLTNGPLLKEVCEPESLAKLVRLVQDGVPETKALSLSPVNIVWSLFALQVWWDVWFGGCR